MHFYRIIFTTKKAAVTAAFLSFLFNGRSRSASCVVIFGKKIAAFGNFVGIDEGSDDDKGTEDIPEPEILCAQFAVEAAAFCFCAHTVAELMVPYEGIDTSRKTGQQEENEAEMHGLFAVISAGDCVDVLAYAGPEYDGINTESY